MEEFNRQDYRKKLKALFVILKPGILKSLELEDFTEWRKENGKYYEHTFTTGANLAGKAVYNTETKKIEKIKYITLEPVVHTIKL